MDLGLSGKFGIVVGGSRGIGKAIALELAREGVDLAIAARNAERLQASAAEISAATGRRVYPLVCDVISREQVDAMVEEAVAELGGLHILINSGSAPGGSATAVGYIDSIVDEDFLDDFNVKYLGALRCTRACIPHLQCTGWGRIVNISGLNARIAGNLSGGARNTSLVHFTKTLANQLGRSGITVNCIHPGITRTERTASRLAARAERKGVSAREVEAADYAQGARRANAIGRMVDAAEIAHLAAYLCSDKAWAVTGETIAADGGGGTFVYY
ncbi:MAG: SDR family oxidoreductase [Pseudomonadales bacterium]|jgi:NAD(P)-dependent dehydrogenase (short-subunit alcohol dehydrogenase family)|nr:SDR family oxidoreductase [Pseudomonadales bacterium]MDP6471624.1 SDR family oxidoreductase [Pseudomonadales bacterium]MDP6970499.1 SDR family oxidoreductase [Pseudomonadales bacterium]|tara:strand:- start:1187 stop:2005 length:819 start_codon:yes stop_codon:yes gene_type:complete